MSNPVLPDPTAEQVAAMRRLKALLPFRVVWGEVDRATGAFNAYASKTMRAPLDSMRAGNVVFLLVVDQHNNN